MSHESGREGQSLPLLLFDSLVSGTETQIEKKKQNGQDKQIIILRSENIRVSTEPKKF